MTLISRDTLVERPELVDRGTEEDKENNESDEQEVLEVLGEGDGPTVNNITFEKGDYGVVAASNITAILSTSQTEGPEYQRAFATSAIQIKQMAEHGMDISPLVQMARSRGVDDVNVSRSQLNDLQLATEDEEEGDQEVVEDEQSVDIEADEEVNGEEEADGTDEEQEEVDDE